MSSPNLKLSTPSRELDNSEEQQCDNLGYVFSQSGIKAGFDSEDFIQKWMNSEVAEGYDNDVHWTHGMSEMYLFEYLEDVAGPVKKADECLPSSVLYWIGYMYKYIGQTEGKSSKELYKMFNADDMKKFYVAFHVMGAACAAGNMLDVYKERQHRHISPNSQEPVMQSYQKPIEQLSL